ncbi:MAG: hypothetical protein Ta2E_11350 [Mycoplasmoidaceae bacterium]|nr:MAG: hypothetical protein Ta2E_11350 [Mycoplasmoidaceae bacterium]
MWKCQNARMSLSAPFFDFSQKTKSDRLGIVILWHREFKNSLTFWGYIQLITMKKEVQNLEVWVFIHYMQNFFLCLWGFVIDLIVLITIYPDFVLSILHGSRPVLGRKLQIHHLYSVTLFLNSGSFNTFRCIFYWTCSKVYCRLNHIKFVILILGIDEKIRIVFLEQSTSNVRSFIHFSFLYFIKEFIEEIEASSCLNENDH